MFWGAPEWGRGSLEPAPGAGRLGYVGVRRSGAGAQGLGDTGCSGLGTGGWDAPEQPGPFAAPATQTRRGRMF